MPTDSSAEDRFTQRVDELLSVVGLKHQRDASWRPVFFLSDDSDSLERRVAALASGALPVP